MSHEGVKRVFPVTVLTQSDLRPTSRLRCPFSHCCCSLTLADETEPADFHFLLLPQKLLILKALKHDDKEHGLWSL